MTREAFVPLFTTYLGKYDRYLIGGHQNPDGDCIGAAVALGLALKESGKEAFLYFDGSTADYQEVASLLPPLELEEAEALMDAKPCAFILLDAADDERLGKGQDLPKKAIDFICVDHHVRTVLPERLTYVESDSSATCEILYHLFKLAGIPITKDMAESLHMGVCFDTGGFRHAGTTADTFRMAADLVELGADNTALQNHLFHTVSFKELKVLGTVYKNAKLYADGILLSAMTEADFSKTGAAPEDASGVVGRLAECAEAEVTIYLRKTPEKILVSLRSKHYVDVAAVARQFGGGGHVRAAGCSFQDTPMLLAKQQILKAVRDQMKTDMPVQKAEDDVQ